MNRFASASGAKRLLDGFDERVAHERLPDDDECPCRLRVCPDLLVDERGYQDDRAIRSGTYEFGGKPDAVEPARHLDVTYDAVFASHIIPGEQVVGSVEGSGAVTEASHKRIEGRPHPVVVVHQHDQRLKHLQYPSPRPPVATIELDIVLYGQSTTSYEGISDGC